MTAMGSDESNHIYDHEAELKAFEQRRVPLDKIAV